MSKHNGIRLRFFVDEIGYTQLLNEVQTIRKAEKKQQFKHSYKQALVQANLVRQQGGSNAK